MNNTKITFNNEDYSTRVSFGFVVVVLAWFSSGFICPICLSIPSLHPLLGSVESFFCTLFNLFNFSCKVSLRILFLSRIRATPSFRLITLVPLYFSVDHSRWACTCSICIIFDLFMLVLYFTPSILSNEKIDDIDNNIFLYKKDILVL